MNTDGTVKAVGDNKCGQCNVSSWSDVVVVAAGNVHMATNTGNAHSVGLKGWNEYGQCDITKPFSK